MARIILTFPSLRSVLAAEKALRENETPFDCRVTPIPPQLAHKVCGIAVELLSLSERKRAVDLLTKIDLSPSGIHDVE
jgi:hypothetical protein